MTCSTTDAKSCTRGAGRAAAPRAARAAGFTLVEMLVVLGIIIVLVGILTPMVNRAFRRGEEARMMADLQAIGLALEQYKSDHGDYPRIGPPYVADTGSRVLCAALFGPGPATGAGADGAGDPNDPTKPGFGFRTRKGGKVWQPYLTPDNWQLRDPASADTSTPGPVERWVVTDRNRKRILYYAADGNPNIWLPRAFVAAVPPESGHPKYNAADNGNTANGGLDPLKFKQLMGDANGNGTLDKAAGEQPRHNGAYILWSPGTDGEIGTKDDVSYSPEGG